MKKSEKIVLALLVGSFLSGCVSTTTGTPPPEADDDDAAELNYQLGARYYQNGTYELARDRLKGAIELDPRMAKAYTTLGLTYEALDNQRLARGLREWYQGRAERFQYAEYLRGVSVQAAGLRWRKEIL